MKIACLQMDVKLGSPDENFVCAESLIGQAMEEKPDVLVLPETWNTGFCPKEICRGQCEAEGKRVKRVIGRLAKKFQVNIVAGSVSHVRDGRLYNTALVFDREGSCIASYDKTHLFTPMGEDEVYEKGDHLCRFTLDGARCGVIICYDLRFPELTRSLALTGLDMLFVVSQWPEERIFHLRSLTTARAIENQVFVVCCNGCGTAGKTVFGGNSAVIAPWGETLAQAGSKQQILMGDCDLSVIQEIHAGIPVFSNRRPELY